ncbi:Cell division protein FtsA [Buchnera aphidicola (Thelaxes suberi)]|uniref:cell division protein FtsA n=1 Tax=Buchnera aphidicola TaxID=9 RepID=UPI003464D525
MIKSVNRELLVGLDIGAKKIITLVGEIVDSKINIIGFGECKSQGIDRNGINDFDSVVDCIKNCINQAEKTAKCKINSVLLSISNKSIYAQNETGLITIPQEEITDKDVRNVIHTAKTVQIKNEHSILHTIPKEYIIDKKYTIKNPIGMSGIRMESNIHLITCSKNIVQNLNKAIKKSGINSDQMIFSGLASSYSVLTKQERHFGACTIDIGAENIDITIHFSNALEYSKVIPYAGNIVTKDIAYAFSISNNEAEKIKIKYGSASECDVIKNDTIEVFNVNGDVIKKIAQQKLTEVIESRYTELLFLIKNEIIKAQEIMAINNKNNEIRGGIILTGGGTKIDSIIPCAQKVFNNFPVRIGTPEKIIEQSIIELNKPEYSTVVGLLKYGKTKLNHIKNINNSKFSFKEMLKKMGTWLKNNF